ncbi:MAG: LysM peptidoglycan-binding domain-containing protein [Candidatus Desulfofervidaceae bacterium]|nr:LysM peptidoglycan-binding domain-containing protein [Candidatus Desulfofervidaceae bacterium]
MPTVPITINEYVQAYINYYTHTPRGRYHFQQTLKRARQYQPLMEAILIEAKLPKEFFYLAFIESSFNNHAYSYAHACGPWQFIESTARKYGLKIDFWVDERKDPKLATKAAARYLSELYQQFNDWYLTAAAYNAGDGTIKRLIRKYKVKDYWALIRKAKELKLETKHYVPKWLATIIIARNPQRYGFQTGSVDPWNYDIVNTPGLTDLSYLAKKTRISFKKLKRLNPALKRAFTPPYNYFLRIPKEKKSIVIAYLQEQMEMTQVFSRFRTYEVKPGDSLWKIAKKYRKDIHFIAKLNGLSYPYLLKPGRKLLIPYGEPQRQVYTETDKRTGQTRIIYTVKSGDSLWKIARHFNTSIKELERINQIKGPLYPGDQLVVPIPSQIIIYEVKQGDTLWDIARKFKTTLKEIMSLNNLSSPRIHPGEKLKIKTSG